MGCVRRCVGLSVGSLSPRGCTTCPSKLRLLCQTSFPGVYRPPTSSRHFPHPLASEPLKNTQVNRKSSSPLLLRVYEMSAVRLVSATVSSETSRTTRTVAGSWDLIPTTAIPEAGSSTIISGTRVSIELPTSPPQAPTHAPHQSLQQGEVDPFDNFFGVSHSPSQSSRVAGTRESRHDVIPPPYHNGEDLPAYSRWDEEAGQKEPPTLAMYMFKYGFCKSHSSEHSHGSCLWVL